MATYTWDHIHLRTPNQEATAQWFERIFGAQVIRSTMLGKPRIDMKLGGANIFLAEVTPGDGVNAPPATPYQGLDHFGLAVSGIDAIAADLKKKGVEFGTDCWIYEVCNPVQAKKVLEANGAVSTALPCRISVYGKEGAYTLATLLPTALMKMFGSAELEPVAREVETCLLYTSDAADE